MINEEILFSEYETSEKILKKISEGKCDDIFEGLCKIKNNNIVIEYIYFKHFATKETYQIITHLITNKIDKILTEHTLFTVHANMKSLSMAEVDKHKNYIYFISAYLKDKYPNKLSKCYIYNSPYIFCQIYNIVSLFIDKETLTKINIIS